jgi:CDP-diacylglycerol--glycerol-3-phosphate 3-phosphatidyltransferase
MNIPNSLTIFRIILIPIFIVVMLTGIPHGDYLAAVIFVIAAVTDSIDGYLARKWKQVTKLGIILDPLADKLLIASALIVLVELGKIPSWMVIVIIGREFAVTGLRAIKAEEGYIRPAAGKRKPLPVSSGYHGYYGNGLPGFRRLPLGMWPCIGREITLSQEFEYFRRPGFSLPAASLQEDGFAAVNLRKTVPLAFWLTLKEEKKRPPASLLLHIVTLWLDYRYLAIKMGLWSML